VAALVDNVPEPSEFEGGRNWCETELDSEHIWFRGFHVSALDGAFRIDDPEVDPLPDVIVRAAWGYATRNETRPSFPFDFVPSVLTGTQFCFDNTVRLPTMFLSTVLDSPALNARGAWVGWDHPSLDFTDRLEVVFAPSTAHDLPRCVRVAQVVFDLRQLEADPFVVVATREPLIADLRVGEIVKSCG
jgi:hypothetical protein